MTDSRPLIFVVDDDRSLDRWQAVVRGVAGEIRVGLGDEVRRFTHRQDAGLGVKAAIADVDGRDGGRRRLSEPMQPEGALHGIDAVVQIEQLADVAAREQQRAFLGSHGTRV